MLNSKIYRSQLDRRIIYRYLLVYFKALSREFGIPAINYTLTKDYHLESADYDVNFPGYRILEFTEFNDDVLGLINHIKDYFGDVYDEYLQQLLLAYFISDFDRDGKNIKMYEQDGEIHLIPYMDISSIFNSLFLTDLASDYYYFPADDMEKWAEESNKLSDGSFIVSTDSINQEFNRLLKDNSDALFSLREPLWSDITWETILNIIFTDLIDKTVIERIANTPFGFLKEKYFANFPENVITLIESLYLHRQRRLIELYNQYNKEINSTATPI